jgi:hypothetical protein
MSADLTDSAAACVDAIFEDLRDRKFLKWLFSDRGEECLIDNFRDGTPLCGLDLQVQDEIRAAWAGIIQQTILDERDRCAKVAETFVAAADDTEEPGDDDWLRRTISNHQAESIAVSIRGEAA